VSRRSLAVVAVIAVATLVRLPPSLLRSFGAADIMYAQSNTVTFTNIAQAAGLALTSLNGASGDKYLVETMGSGALFFDFDDDGWVDVLLVDGGSYADPAVAAKARHRLYRNQGNGTFRDISASSGLTHPEYGMGACAGDVDNDGRIDVYLTNAGANALYKNMGGGVFTDITRTAGVGLTWWSTSCAFVDVDHDGDLDLFVANYLDAPKNINPFCGDPQRRVRAYCHPLNYKGMPSVLYRNDGAGRFTDVSADAGIAKYVGNGLGVAVGDYDDDGWPDVFVANDAVPNFLFHNQGNGRFTEVGLAAGVSVARDGKPRAGMGTEFADYNGDGRLDLVVTNHEFETHSLFRNDGRGLFTDATIDSGIGPPTLPYVGFGVAFVDVDNDAQLDLAIVNGHVIDNTAMFRAGSTHAQRKLLLRNTNGRRFVDVGRQAGAGFAQDGVGRTLIAADIDNDGDVDLLVTNNGGAPELLRNDGGHRLNAIEVRALSRGRDAIGARVTVTAAGRSVMREIKSGSSYLGQSDLRAHFGLGASTSIDRMEIRWPSGRVERIDAPPVNQIITVEEGKGIAKRAPFSKSG
jgi:enediyne biosynthesis protein E4